MMDRRRVRIHSPLCSSGWKMKSDSRCLSHRYTLCGRVDDSRMGNTSRMKHSDFQLEG